MRHASLPAHGHMEPVDLRTSDGKVELLRRMVLVRAFEDTVRDRYADGEIPGFVHLSQGQEAVAVGAGSVLENDDYFTSTHRAHGHSIAVGLDPSRLLAELYGKKTGYCKGKGGSMHVAALDEGMLGAQPIVGESAPLATGAGITAQYTDGDWITLAFVGDGAVAAGQVHEAFNLASTWALPVVYLIENNLYSEGMRFDEQHNIEDLVDVAAAYGVPGEIVDGQDVEAVREVVDNARERAVAGEGPTLIEAKTYRYRGHFEGDEQPYRSDEEIDEWRSTRDPIANYAERLLDDEILTDGEYDNLEEDVENTIADALAFAREGDEAHSDAAYDDVFVDGVPEIEAHRERLAREASGWEAH